MCTSCPDTSTCGMPITKFEEKGKKKKDSVEMDKKTDHVIGKLQYCYDIKIQSNKNNLKPVQTATKKSTLLHVASSKEENKLHYLHCPIRSDIASTIRTELMVYQLVNQAQVY